MQQAFKSMYQYIVKVGECIEKQFPEIDFIIKNTMFLDPRIRYSRDEGPITFSIDTIKY